jgi:hypothetical protein
MGYLCQTSLTKVQLTHSDSKPCWSKISSQSRVIISAYSDSMQVTHRITSLRDFGASLSFRKDMLDAAGRAEPLANSFLCGSAIVREREWYIYATRWRGSDSGGIGLAEKTL